MPTDSTKSGFSGTSSTSEERSRRRSERVVLCVPILLSARILHGRRISIDAKSLVVNAHGGLLDVGLELMKGQHIILNNPITERVATGKILRVERSEEGRFFVAFEFEFPTPNFWPIVFPPADWTSGPGAA